VRKRKKRGSPQSRCSRKGKGRKGGAGRVRKKKKNTQPGEEEASLPSISHAGKGWQLPRKRGGGGKKKETNQGFPIFCRHSCDVLRSSSLADILCKDREGKTSCSGKWHFYIYSGRGKGGGGGGRKRKWLRLS